MTPTPPPLPRLSPPLSEAQAQRIDAALWRDKQLDGYWRRAQRRAWLLQLQLELQTGVPA